MAPHPADGKPLVALVVVIFTVESGALQVLLIRRSAPPFQGLWALPGGVFSGDEALGEAAARRLVEETGLQDVYLEQLYTFTDLDSHLPAVAVTYFALVNHTQARLQQRRRWRPAWHAVANLAELAFDNRAVIDYALTRLRYKLEYTNVAYSLLPDSFTLSELQRVYESILGRPLDKRNFRKWILGRDIVRPTGSTRSEGAHRPARLYAFTSRQPVIL
jgi:8-oxo-dGTP diphosphatase